MSDIKTERILKEMPGKEERPQALYWENGKLEYKYW